MRGLALAALICLSSGAMADRLISIPKGNKYRSGSIRAEFMGEPSRSGTTLGYLGLGINDFFDAEIRYERFRGHESGVTVDFAYNLNAPFSDKIPGISLGVLDALDETRDGLRGFIAITNEHTTMGDFEGAPNVEITYGVTFGSRNTAFVGAKLPFSDAFQGMVEYNGNRITAGADFKTKLGLTFRMVFSEHETLLGAWSTFRF